MLGMVVVVVVVVVVVLGMLVLTPIQQVTFSLSNLRCTLALIYSRRRRHINPKPFQVSSKR